MSGQPRVTRAVAGGTMLVAVLALALAGCDEPAGPAGLEPDGAGLEAGLASVATAGSSPRFVSNTVRYRDTGVQPAVGRSGSAMLTAHALMTVPGGAELHLTAGSTRGETARLGQVQILVFDAAGRRLYVRNDVPGPNTATASYELGGIGRDSRVQVKANVVGADPARVGVVTVDVPVGLRPDLQVVSLAAPGRVAHLTMVGIAATVREANGDLGATADCVLLVDGEEMDRAWGIWVDAGSSVTCAFRHRFERLGSTEVEVRLLEVTPGDSDPDNNSARAIVDVVHVPSAFSYDAFFEDRTFEENWRYEYRWTSPDGRNGGEGSDEGSRMGREQHGFLWGYTPRSLVFPLDEFVVQQMTRDETVHSARFLNVEPDWSWSDDWGSEACIDRWFDTEKGMNSVSLCSVEPTYGDAFSYVYYTRYAGDVTYHARGGSRWWDLDAGYEDVYSWNYSDSHVVGRMASYGKEYGFFIWFQDAQGVYRMQPLVWLHPFEEAHEYPWSCYEFSSEWGSSRDCYEFSSRSHGFRGFVQGWPTYLP